MKLCITGGGTGGHLMIARSLLSAAVAKGHEVIFIGSLKGQDQKYFAKGSQFSQVYFLKTTGVVNQKGLGKCKALYKTFKAFVQARRLLEEHSIDAVYSVGGFSAAAASFAGLSKGIPLFIHEQNAVEGRLNKLLKPCATQFISAYDTTSPIRGYPVEQSFISSARVRTQLKSIIFLGGSHGAKAINDLALFMCLEFQKRGIHIIHQAGENDYERVKNEYDALGVEVELYSFTKELPLLISKADLAVSRAGASTLWELITNGCPALYVPYPFAAGDHQYYNAQFIVQKELGWCEREEKGLDATLLKILDLDLEKKSEALLAYTSIDVASQMIDEVSRKLHD